MGVRKKVCLRRIFLLFDSFRHGARLEVQIYNMTSEVTFSRVSSFNLMLCGPLSQAEIYYMAESRLCC